MSVRKVIGIHSCLEALKARKREELKQIYLKPDWSKHPALRELERLAQSQNLSPEILSLKKLNQMGESHQGVCVFVDHEWNEERVSFGEKALVLILDRLQDPRNLGAIIRTAWLMSVDAIFISRRESCDLSPSVIKAACGGLEHVPVIFKENLRQCLEELKKNQFWIYALDSHSKKSLWEVKLEGRLAFLIGGEALGVRPGLKKSCDEMLAIPQKEKGASYNVSVATALALGEYLRQKTLNPN